MERSQLLDPPPATNLAASVLLLLLLLLQPRLSHAQTADHPVYRRSTCPGRLWQPDEVPQLHEINLVMAPEDFRWQIDHQDTQYEDARDMNITTIIFNGESFAGGHFKVHGGKYQRGGGQWDGEPDRRGNTIHDMEGGNCYRRGDDTFNGTNSADTADGVQFRCKPSFRLKFSKSSPYNAVFDTLYRYPADKRRCNDPHKFVLNGNWNDPAHIRSKITQDLVKAAGGLAPRIEFARLSINGQYFGMYSIEESLTDHWANCMGIDMAAELADEAVCQQVGAAADSPLFEDQCRAAGQCTPVVEIEDACVLRGHDPSACRENGGLDTDCCAVNGTASCADGFTFVQGTEPCYQTRQWTAFPSYCAAAGTDTVPETYPDCDLPDRHDRRMCRENGQFDRDCRALPDSASCAEGHTMSMSTDCMESGACRYTCMLPRTGTDAASCAAGCDFIPAVFRCDPSAEATDPLEVAQSTILKNDHGPCSAWPASPGDDCADGFERKSPSCKHCDNDFLLRNNPVDYPQCECDDVPQLQPLFHTINSGTKDEVAAAINLTSVFVYQSSVALGVNIDTGSHNYYMSKQPGQPWRVINVDPDWSWGHGYSCKEEEGGEMSSDGRVCEQSACLSLPFGPDPSNLAETTATEVEFNRYCCGVSPNCTDGYHLVDQEGTQGAEICYQTMYRICCVEDGPRPPPPPPLAPDEESVHRIDHKHCPYNAEADQLFGAQSNQFLSADGAFQEHFQEEYYRFFREMLAKPEYQGCAVADAAAVLLDAESGVIRAAYDEDRTFWHRPGDADEELEFISAWARLRIASVSAALDGAMAELHNGSSGSGSGLASCGTAAPEGINQLCDRAGLVRGQGVCDQGTLHPRCVLPAAAGYDRCNCPPGYGWSRTTWRCEVGGSTSDEEAESCLLTRPAPPPPANAGDSGGSGGTVLVILLLLAVSGIAVAAATVWKTFI